MKNTRSIALSYGSERIVLDVNPKRLSVSYPQIVRKYSLMDGEYAEVGGQALRTANIETFLPSDKSSMRRQALSQQTVLSTFYDWKKNKRKVRMVVSGMENGTYYITNLTTTAVEGDEDIYIRLELIECRDI